MNNTKNLAIVAVLIAATLVVGVTFATTQHNQHLSEEKTEMRMVIQLPNRNANNTAQ